MRQQRRHDIPRLDQLRLLAAALVVFSHSWDMFFHATEVDGLRQLLFRVGDAGVALFFVMSGFIFTHLAEINRQDGEVTHFIDYKSFLYNRAVRIFPLLIFMYAVSWACESHDLRLSDVLYPVLLMANTGTAVKHGYPMLWSITWTIAVEFQFYLVFPFLYQFFVQRGLKYLLGFVGLMVILRFSAHYSEFEYGSQMSYLTLPYRIDQFIAGMALALFMRSKISKRVTAAGVPLAVAALVGLAYLYGYDVFLRHNYAAHAWFSTAEGLLWATFVWGSLTRDWFTRDFIGRHIARVGTASYSLYLTHLFVVLPVTKFVREQMGWQWNTADSRTWMLYPVVCLVIFPLTCALAMLVYSLIEKPFFQFRTSYYRPRTPTEQMQESLDSAQTPYSHGMQRAGQ